MRKTLLVEIPIELAEKLIAFLNRRMERDRWMREQVELMTAIRDCIDPERKRPDSLCPMCHGTGNTFNRNEEYIGDCFCVKAAYLHGDPTARALEIVRPRAAQSCDAEISAALAELGAHKSHINVYGAVCKLSHDARFIVSPEAIAEMRKRRLITMRRPGNFDLTKKGLRLAEWESFSPKRMQ